MGQCFVPYKKCIVSSVVGEQKQKQKCKLFTKDLQSLPCSLDVGVYYVLPGHDDSSFNADGSRKEFNPDDYCSLNHLIQILNELAGPTLE